MRLAIPPAREYPSGPSKESMWNCIGKFLLSIFGRERRCRLCASAILPREISFAAPPEAIVVQLPSAQISTAFRRKRRRIGVFVVHSLSLKGSVRCDPVRHIGVRRGDRL